MDTQKILNSQVVSSKHVRALVHALESAGEVTYGVQYLSPSPGWEGPYSRMDKALERVQVVAESLERNAAKAKPSQPFEGGEEEGESG